MRKRLLMGILMLATCASAFSSSDQLDSIHNQLTLQEVEVWAERATTAAGSFALPMVSDITREEIAALPVQSVADILKYNAGVDVRTRGASGAQADVSLRGGTFDQVVILLNGVNLTDAQTGHYSLNLPVTVELIDRIEIRDNTINIITKQSRLETLNLEPLNQALLRLTSGMNALVNPAATLRLRREDWYLNASAEYTRSDGYYAPAPSAKEQTALNNSDLKLANLFLQTGYKDLDVQLGAQYKDAGAGMFYGFGSQDQFDATRTGFAAARYTHSWEGLYELEAAVSYRANYDHYWWHRGQTPGSNRHLTQNAGASLKGSAHYNLEGVWGYTNAGMDLRNENIRSTNLRDTNRLNLNYFVEQSFTYRHKYVATLLLNGNWNTMFGHNYSGSADFSYQYAYHSSVYLTANRSLRMPTFTDLYYDAGNQLGNPDLQPEEAWTVSVGTKYEHSFNSDLLYLNADAYYRWGRNIIDWVYTPDDTKRPYHAQNHNQVDATGVNLTLGYKRDRWLRNIEVSYAYTWLDLDLNKSGSRYLDYLSHKLVARLEHDIFRFPHPSSLTPHPSSVLGASWTLTWQKREGQYNTAEGQVANFTPVLLLDAQLFWEHPCVKIALECTNLTNRHYYDYGGILQPGAWAKLTISANLSTLARTLH